MITSTSVRWKPSGMPGTAPKRPIMPSRKTVA